MMERVRGVVLRQIKYNDDSVIVSIFTNKYGCISSLIKFGRGGKDNARCALFRPLNVLEFDVLYSATKSFQKLKEVRQALVYTTLSYNPMKEMVGLFLADFLYQALKREVCNEELFAFLCDSLEWFDRSTSGIANFHIAFMIRLTHYLGVWPNLPSDTGGMVLDLKEGTITDSLPIHGMYLDAGETAVVPTLLRMNFQNMKFFRLNRLQRARILEVILAYYRLHIPDFRELKSQDVLREVLS